MSLSQWFKPATWLSTLQSLPQPVRNGLFRASCLLAPVFLFLCFFNPFVLDPTRVGWLLDEDWGQHVLGWNAFRHMPWSTFNHETLLGAPMGNTIISTDSNPLFAFFFKTFGPFLPEVFQYIGPWFLFCVCLHFTFAYKLVRPHAPGRWAAFGAAIALSALPMLYYRMRHDTLVAQWLVLWSLHIFINAKDDQLPETDKGPLGFVISWFRNGHKMLRYVALLGISGLIHPYLLFMIAAIWGGDVLKRFWPAARTFDRSALLDTALRSVFVFAAAIVALFISGSFTKGMSPGAGGYGFYSFPLDGWFNPVKPDFSTILKAWPLDSGQAFEGYQYLGFGLIVLVVTAVVLYFTTPEARTSRPFFAKLKPLTLPFIALFLIAASNHGQFYGYDIWSFQVPKPLVGPLAVLRASGRLVWPITYCLVLAALVVLFRSRPRTIAIVLPAILVIQAYDISGISSAMRRATALAARDEAYYLTPSPDWDKLVTASTGIDFYPPNVHLNDRLFYELTWRATSQAKPVNTMYAARQNLIQVSLEQQGLNAFKRGQVRNDRLFVFLKQCDVPAELQSRVRMVDGVWVIPPDKASAVALDKPEWDPIQAKVRFGWLDQGNCMLDENWTSQETDGIWTAGPEAGVMLPIRYMELDAPKAAAMDLTFKARSREPVVASVLINGKKVSDITLTRHSNTYSVPLPASALRGEDLKVRFEIDQPEALPQETPMDASSKSAASKASGGRSSAAAKTATAAPSPAIKLMNMELVERTAVHTQQPEAPGSKPLRRDLRTG